MKRLIFILLVLVISSCGPSENEIAARIDIAVRQTNEAESTPTTKIVKETVEVPVEITVLIDVTRHVEMPITVTPDVFATSAAATVASRLTQAVRETETVSINDLWSKNYVGHFDSGGVVIEIARVLVGYKTALPDWQWHELDDYIEGWADIEVVGELI